MTILEKKLVNKLIAGFFLGSISIGAYAACGDSTCGWEGGKFNCTVETPEGARICSEDSRCNINCN